MTKRKNKATGIEAMAGDGFQPSEPTESSVKNMFEDLVKDNQTPDHYFTEESGPIEPILEAMAKETGFSSVEETGEKTWTAEEVKQDYELIVEFPENQTEEIKAQESTPYTRLIEEEKDLRSRFDKLQKFLRDPLKAKSTVGEEQFNLLIKQYGYMGSYLEILTKRIQLFN